MSQSPTVAAAAVSEILLTLIFALIVELVRNIRLCIRSICLCIDDLPEYGTSQSSRQLRC